MDGIIEKGGIDDHEVALITKTLLGAINYCHK